MIYPYMTGLGDCCDGSDPAMDASGQCLAGAVIDSTGLIWACDCNGYCCDPFNHCQSGPPSTARPIEGANNVVGQMGANVQLSRFVSSLVGKSRGAPLSDQTRLSLVQAALANNPVDDSGNIVLTVPGQVWAHPLPGTTLPRPDIQRWQGQSTAPAVAPLPSTTTPATIPQTTPAQQVANQLTKKTVGGGGSTSLASSSSNTWYWIAGLAAAGLLIYAAVTR